MNFVFRCLHLADQHKHQPLKLLTCSKTQDRSIIIWQPEGVVEDSGDNSDDDDEGGGMWLEVARLGEVGGNLEGYFACQFSPSANHLLGCNYQVRCMKSIYSIFLTW